MMKFNPDEVIRITNKRKVVNSEYTIHGQILRSTDKAKYLLVTTDSTLSWNHQMDNIRKKTNNTTAVLRQNLSSCPPDVKATCYKALGCPQLEYASSICETGTLTHSQISIRLQLCSIFVTGDLRQTSRVSSMLEHLGWEGLHTCRQHGKMILMYRIVNHLVKIHVPVSTILRPVSASRI